ncbi:MAG: hypothetical protein OXG44_12875, partial [Gammaproteobacteria bacterium]|nr:hypothetical protein [Gammaproteobacteria bacterium]
VELGDRVLLERLSLRTAWTWGNYDPQAAYDWAVAQASSQMQGELIHPVMSTIARSAPEDAISLASRLDDALQRAAAFRSVFATWAQSDVRAAARWIEASPQPPSDVAYQLIPAYAKVDPEEAFDWLMSLDASQHRHVDRLITETAKGSPDRARQLLDRIPGGPAKERAAGQLVTTWISVDPQAAVGVIPRLGVDETDALYKNAFRTWCESDPDVATAFLGRVPMASRDSAIMGVIDHALSRGNDVALAERMYNRLTSNDMRREAAATLHSRLRAVDPARAKRYGG